MSETERRLSAAVKKYRARQEEDAFSTESARVRGREPVPTKEMVAGWKPDETPSMYKTIRAIMDGETVPPASDSGKFRTFN